MKKRHHVGFAGILLWFLLGSVAIAHSPYFLQTETLETPDYGTVTFAVLYGDGIFGADSSQVVVFNETGVLLAATPEAYALTIQCSHSDDQRSCLIYDELQGIVIEPDFPNWAPGRLIEVDGKPHPDAYPELMGLEYGFTTRPAGFIERVAFNARSLFSSPVESSLAVLWWCFVCSLVARPIWKWKRNGWRIWPARWSSIAVLVVRAVLFLWMSFLAAYSWALGPYSLMYFSFVFSLGALFAIALTRPKADEPTG